MSGVNKVIIIGNLGGDPEVRYMPNGNAVANFSIATSETWEKDGEKKEKTEWHKLVAFKRTAEIIEQYLKKGSKVYVEGKLQTRNWEQDGQKHYMTEIVVQNLQMLDSRNTSPQQGASQSAPPAQAAQPAGSAGSASAPSNFDNFEDDIPF